MCAHVQNEVVRLQANHLEVYVLYDVCGCVEKGEYDRCDLVVDDVESEKGKNVQAEVLNVLWVVQLERVQKQEILH